MAARTDVDHSAGFALCLSGGGYRAMVFHLGVLHRLNEAGILKRLSRISSVSGGSITSAFLGMNWHALDFDADGVARQLSIVDAGIRRMADTTIDIGAVAGGIFSSQTVGERLADRYDEVLFAGATLDALPDDDEGPRFVINATNVQSAALWRFSKPYVGDYRIGLWRRPDIRLADAVAASSAFPPMLSPFRLRWKEAGQIADGDLRRSSFEGEIVLTDGGVYDNLGLETAFKRCSTILVSDGGQKISPQTDPADDWGRHALRIMDIVDDQVRSLRKRQLMHAFERREKAGAYWSIRNDVEDFQSSSDPLGCRGRDAGSLAALPTRLKKMPLALQDRIVNWGYALTDVALRTKFAEAYETLTGTPIREPLGFPAPGGY